MKINNYLQKVSNVYKANSLLKFGFVILLIMQISNYQQQKEFMNDQRMILTPIGHANGLWVSNNNASDEYFLFMTDYIMGLLGNYTTATVAEQYAKLSTLFSPEKIGEAKRKLDKVVKDISRFATAGSTINYLSNDVDIDRQRKMIRIVCINDRYLNGVKSGSSAKEYYIFYEIKSSRFWIRDIKEGKNV